MSYFDFQEEMAYRREMRMAMSDLSDLFSDPVSPAERKRRREKSRRRRQRQKASRRRLRAESTCPICCRRYSTPTSMNQHRQAKGHIGPIKNPEGKL